MDDEVGPTPRWSWQQPDRRDLYRAISVITAPGLTPVRAAVAVHGLLVGLEIFEDPQQGIGLWLFPDEVALLEDLGGKLQKAAEGLAATGVESALLKRPEWDDSRKSAQALKSKIEINGTGGVPR